MEKEVIIGKTSGMEKIVPVGIEISPLMAPACNCSCSGGSAMTTNAAGSGGCACRCQYDVVLNFAYEASGL